MLNICADTESNVHIKVILDRRRVLCPLLHRGAGNFRTHRIYSILRIGWIAKVVLRSLHVVLFYLPTCACACDPKRKYCQWHDRRASKTNAQMHDFGLTIQQSVPYCLRFSCSWKSTSIIHWLDNIYSMPKVRMRCLDSCFLESPRIRPRSHW